MRVDWSPLVSELAIWRSERRALPLWWRDDDAVANTPELENLLGLARELGLCVHLAVIPKSAEQSLVGICAASPWAVPMVHGWAHENNAAQDEKKAEFGHPRDGAIEEAEMGLTHLRNLFGDDLLPIFVPPWNRIDAGIVAQLPRLGYAGLSAFTPRAARFAAPGLVQINTHIDPIHWRAGGGLLDPQTQIAALVRLLIDRRVGRTDAAEPLGFLTHHLVHDPEIWAFTRACLSVMLDHGATPINLATMKETLP